MHIFLEAIGAFTVYMGICWAIFKVGTCLERINSMKKDIATLSAKIEENTIQIQELKLRDK
jgi:hypothetical protein